MQREMRAIARLQEQHRRRNAALRDFVNRIRGREVTGPMEPTKSQLVVENAELREFAEAVHDLACDILGEEDDPESEEEQEGE